MKFIKDKIDKYRNNPLATFWSIVIFVIFGLGAITNIVNWDLNNLADTVAGIIISLVALREIYISNKTHGHITWFINGIRDEDKRSNWFGIVKHKIKSALKFIAYLLLTIILLTSLIWSIVSFWNPHPIGSSLSSFILIAAIYVIHNLQRRISNLENNH